MADTKTSDLPTASLDGGEQFPCVDAALLKIATLDEMRTALCGVVTLVLDITMLREIATNDIDTRANAGGLLGSDTTPALKRENLATDKSLVVFWAAGNVDEAQFPTVPMPPDLDETKDVTIHLVAQMDGVIGPDTPTIDVQVFDGVGDTEMGSPTAALSSTLAELTVTIVAANISGNPLGFLNISLIPGAHANDGIELRASWLEYTRKKPA